MPRSFRVTGGTVWTHEGVQVLMASEKLLSLSASTSGPRTTATPRATPMPPGAPTGSAHHTCNWDFLGLHAMPTGQASDAASFVEHCKEFHRLRRAGIL